MGNVAVIGAGIMGLTCAYDLLKRGHKVDIFEADDRIGGMSAHFDFDGLSIERYYHFICKSDFALFRLLSELGLSSKLNWRDTRMGYFYNGGLYNWGNPWALIMFPKLDIISKLRYGLHMFVSAKRTNWKHLDTIEATTWIKRWIGEKAYQIFWQRLFDLKFHKYVGNLSAAWIWARIKRVGTSRKNLFQEQLGYLQGGSDTLLNRLHKEIESLGGNIHLNTSVERVNIVNGKLSGLKLDDSTFKCKYVVSTIPLPFVSKMLSDLPENYKTSYEKIDNIGVVCIIFKLNQKVTDNFWLNISDPEIEIPGIIEFSNLRPLENNIVYVPYYMPQDHDKYQWADDEFINEAKGYLKNINPTLCDEAFISSHVSRYRFAQPICPPGFANSLPPIKTLIEGVFVADTSYYYPEDRSISESCKLGQQIAAMI